MKNIEYKEDEDKIAWLRIDQAGREVNVINTGFIEDLEKAFTKVESELRLRGVVFTSGKECSFLSGVDLDELEEMRDSEEARRKCLRVQKLMSRIASLDIPTIAAIHGPCLGGGLELALACDIRIATDWKGTTLGLPETRLGLIPGFGGTQRLPRLIGLKDSLKLILSGHEISAKKALTIGLLDDIVPREVLEKEARRQVLSYRKGASRRKDVIDQLLEKSALVRRLLFNRARKSIVEKTQGHYPAPFRAVDVMERGMKEGLAAGHAFEAKTAGDLIISKPARNLLFLARKREENNSYPGPWPSETIGRKVSLAGIVGGGKMGAGISYLLSANDIKVRLKELSCGRISIALGEIASLHRRRSRYVRKTKKYLERKMDSISTTTDYSGFGRVDLVIEAVPEDLSLKRMIFKELEEVVDEGCIIATNTSSLSISGLASGMKVPSRLLGLHFFHPVHKMPLVEIIEGDQTDASAAISVFILAKRLGKIPIVVKDTPGFLVNRILMPYIIESFHLLEEGIAIDAIDQAMVDFGFTVGPFQLIDKIGLEVASKAAGILKDHFESRFPFPKAMDALFCTDRKCDDPRFYHVSGNEMVVNPNVYREIEEYCEKRRETSNLRVQNRLLNAMINEAALCLEEDVVSRAEDIELGTVLGMGFPPFRGGLLRYADHHGIKRVLGELEELAHIHGERFRPEQRIIRMAEEDKVFLPHY